LEPSAILVQLINGLASSSALFLVAVGLSLIFGVTRIVNFAHGAIFMVGLYLAIGIQQWLHPYVGPAAFWCAIVLAALGCAALGVLIEYLVLRRIYAAPELFQLLATFALVLLLQDAVLWVWGPDDLFGPRAPGFKQAVSFGDRLIPAYDLFLIVIAPIVWLGLALLLKKTRFGLILRAATEDRTMAAALGIRQKLLFTGVFALGCALAGLGGALQMPREPATLGLALGVIGDAFVVVVIGGLGSVGGALLAAILIGLTKAICILLGDVALAGTVWNVSKFTLVAEFLVMALVLLFKPHGLFGKTVIEHRTSVELSVLRRLGRPQLLLLLGALLIFAIIPAFEAQRPYLTVLATDMLISILFAASVAWLLGPSGYVSFGHAAYFGLGAYGCAVAIKAGAGALLAAFSGVVTALIAAAICGVMTLRMAGVYRAMFTLAFAQIAWSIIFQWDDITGGSNGLLGLWLQGRFSDQAMFAWLVLGLTVLTLLALYALTFSRFGYALRAVRDSRTRALALGLNPARIEWMAFVIAGSVAGIAGVLFAFSKGSISPDVLAIPKSVEGLAMVLLGGVQTLTGAVSGAIAYVLLSDWLLRNIEYWRAALGATVLLLVIVFPKGLSYWLEKQGNKL
jgi:branched-chain amino acid transport system permease protein